MHLQAHNARNSRLVLVLATLALLAGCGQGQPENLFRHGVARFPDDEGVVTDINFDRVELRDGPVYEILKDVQSFSTYNGKVVPLLHHKGRYIQVGLDEEERVEWIAGIGLVLPGESPTVVYNGVIEKIDKSKRRIVFEDGTVLKYSASVKSFPEPGQRVKATISPPKQQIIEVVPQ